MGAAFSQTAANVFMSVTIRRFLHIQKKSLLLVRFIDDILIWTDTEELKKFSDMNSHNPPLSLLSNHSRHLESNHLQKFKVLLYKRP